MEQLFEESELLEQFKVNNLYGMAVYKTYNTLYPRATYIFKLIYEKTAKEIQDILNKKKHCITTNYIQVIKAINVAQATAPLFISGSTPTSPAEQAVYRCVVSMICSKEPNYFSWKS